ncbi:hypothetical protein GQ42DRAFT_152435 [Ramicandelaber brevisporus]|nr:hypothetical protein GQ42DRAFT_152435 [Ramicandelaber brevisporus]
MRIFAFIALLLLVQLGIAAAARPPRKAAPKTQPKAPAAVPNNRSPANAVAPRPSVQQRQPPKPAARPPAQAIKQRSQQPRQRPQQSNRRPAQQQRQQRPPAQVTKNRPQPSQPSQQSQQRRQASKKSAARTPPNGTRQRNQAATGSRPKNAGRQRPGANANKSGRNSQPSRPKNAGRQHPGAKSGRTGPTNRRNQKSGQSSRPKNADRQRAGVNSNKSARPGANSGRTSPKSSRNRPSNRRNDQNGRPGNKQQLGGHTNGSKSGSNGTSSRRKNSGQPRPTPTTGRAASPTRAPSRPTATSVPKRPSATSAPAPAPTPAGSRSRGGPGKKPSPNSSGPIDPALSSLPGLNGDVYPISNKGSSRKSKQEKRQDRKLDRKTNKLDKQYRRLQQLAETHKDNAAAFNKAASGLAIAAPDDNGGIKRDFSYGIPIISRKQAIKKDVADHYEKRLKKGEFTDKSRTGKEYLQTHRKEESQHQLPPGAKGELNVHPGILNTREDATNAKNALKKIEANEKKIRKEKDAIKLAKKKLNSQAIIENHEAGIKNLKKENKKLMEPVYDAVEKTDANYATGAINYHIPIEA